MAKNVLGTDLETCSRDPLTGWFRNGLCETGRGDMGLHCVCAVMTDDFLAFSRDQGNDLTARAPDFPGLAAGDRWCLCIARWKEALQAGIAPPVVLEATHISTLEFVSLEELRTYAAERFGD